MQKKDCGITRIYDLGENKSMATGEKNILPCIHKEQNTKP